MKKYLPVLLFFIGLAVIVGAFFFIKGRGKTSGEEDERVPEIPLSQRPFTSLTPTSDGHYLNLFVCDQNVEGAESLDYELLYKTLDGITQGVPGTIKLMGKSEIERELLLGSESSGKFRYDEGVEEGKLTLRFRNDRGKLVGKLVTDFHMQSDTKELGSLDGKFTYELARASDEFFVTMETFGLPGPAPGNLASGPYGVFSSDGTDFPGVTNMTHFWNGASWDELAGGASDEIGVFVSLTSE